MDVLHSDIYRRTESIRVDWVLDKQISLDKKK